MSCRVPGVHTVLRTRVLTALVMLLVLYVATVWSTPLQFALFISAVLLVGVYEWTGLMGLRRPAARVFYLLIFLVAMVGIARFAQLQAGSPGLARTPVLLVSGAGVLFWLFAFVLIRHYPANETRWAVWPKTGLMGLLVLLPTWLALIQLKYLETHGALVFALIALVSIADIGAYFSGRAWGRAKLAPKLSPGKSWAGFWGGMACCFFLALALLYPLHHFAGPLSLGQGLAALLAAMVVAVFSVLGDLFESMLKRSQGLKDSGRILPGHGGVLDRIDSLTAAAPVFIFFFLLLFADVSWP